LAEFEMRLDAAMQDRNAEMDRHTPEILRAMEHPSTAHKEVQAIFDREVKLRIAVRDLNDEFTDAIAAKLQGFRGDLTTRFTQTANIRAYPQVYRPTSTQRLIKAAQGLEGIDQATLASINDLEAAYLAELGPVNTQLRKTVTTYEPTQWVSRNVQRIASADRP